MQNTYPYQVKFIQHCKASGLSDTSIRMTNSAVNHFWNYYLSNSQADPTIQNVTSSDVDDYLAQLDIQEHLQTRTINKYLTYLKKYFMFLADYRYISSFPLYKIKGKPFQRNLTITINWMDSLPDFLNLNLHSETIKLLLLISLNYDVKDLLNVRWNDIANNINNSQLRQFIVDSLNFANFQNPTIFQNKVNGSKLTSIETILHTVRLDQDKVAIPLVPVKLRQSYILSIVSKHNLSDKELQQRFNLSSKSLSYYQFCASYYSLIDFKTIKSKA